LLLPKGLRLTARASHLGTVEAADKKSAVDAAAKQFNITPARRNKIMARRSMNGNDQSKRNSQAHVAHRRVPIQDCLFSGVVQNVRIQLTSFLLHEPT
jgi:hypothetical protein